MAAVDHFVVRTPGGPGNWLQWAISGVAEPDHVLAPVPGGHADYLTGGVLVANSGVTTADTEIGGGQHHRHRGLAEVVLVDDAVALGLRFSQHKHDRRG